MSSGLTEEQLKRIEENRKRALALKEANKKLNSGVGATNTVTSNPNVVTSSSSSSSSGDARPVQQTKSFMSRYVSASENLTSREPPPPQPQLHSRSPPAHTPISPPHTGAPPSSRNIMPTALRAAPAGPGVTSPSKQAHQPAAHSIYNNKPNSGGMVSSKPPSNQVETTAATAAVPGQMVGKCVYLETTNGDHSRFEVQVGYNKTLIEIFKLMKTKRYEPETKRWNFSTREYKELMGQVKFRLANVVKLEPLDKDPDALAAKSVQAKFTLYDRNRFDVQADYKPELKAIFDTIHSRKYDPNSKKYSFELKDYDELLKKIAEKFPRGEVSVVALPRAVREVFKEQFAGKNPPRFDPTFNLEHLKSRIDPLIFKRLLPFQVEGICFAAQQNGRLLLADDMGLGKTIQGLAIASYYKYEWPLFIVVPSSVKFMWKESCKTWLTDTIMEMSGVRVPELVDNYIQVIENGRQPIDPTCKIVISSYDLLAKNVDTIAKTHYKVVIADESHLLKNLKTARTKAAVKLIANSTRVILLSGTPALSRPAELFAQINIVNSTLFSTFHEFGLRYCAAKETKFGWDYSGYSNMAELKLLLEEKLLIRREKKDVIQQLPTKMRERVQLDPSLVENKSKTLMQASQLADKSNLKGADKRSAILAYFQETCKSKFRAVCQYVADLIESGKKFLVFAHHQIMLDEVEKECQNSKTSYIRIDGSTQSETRQYLATRFQNEDECRVAILSITAASTGLTLTRANMVVFAELFWNPGILVQAEDRVYRIGQRDSVMIQYLYAKGTADDRLWPLVNEKLNVLSKAGLTKEILSEAKNIDKKDNTTNPNSIANIFKELIEMETAQAAITSSGASCDDPENENSLPSLAIEEVCLESPKNEEMRPSSVESLVEINDEIDDDDDDDALLLASAENFNAIAPPNKKIKK